MIFGAHVVVYSTDAAADRAFLQEGLFDLLATRPVQRAGYLSDYTEATTGFKIARPK